MTRKRILLQSVMDTEDYRNSILAAEFERRGHEIVIATHSARQARMLAGKHPGKVAYIQPSIAAEAEILTAEQAAEFLAAALPGFNVLNGINDDPVFESKPLSMGIRHAAAVAGAYLNLFKQGKFNLFISDNGYLYRRMANTAAMAAKVPMAPIESARIPGRFVIIEDFMGNWKGLADAWKKVTGNGIPPGIVSLADSYLMIFREKGMVKAADAHLGRPQFRLRALMTASKYIWRDLVEEQRLNPYTWAPEIIYRDVSRRFRVMALGFAGYTRPRAGEDHVFLPLPVPWETNLKHRAPLYEDPMNLIHTAARNIPPGWKLYVKEHPVNIGNTPISLLRRISSIENVRLLTPELDSRDLIRSARAVLIVNGTAGLETLLLGKRPMTLVDNFFDVFGFSDRITRGCEICDLSFHGGAGPLPGPEDARKAAAAMLMCTFEGSEYYSDPDNSIYETPKNVRALVDAILSFAAPMREFSRKMEGAPR